MPILFLLLVLYFPSIAGAATYWVDPAGSGSTCSSGSPCTLNTVRTKVVAGDTVNLNSGTYTGSSQMLSWSGTRNAAPNVHTCAAMKGGSAGSLITFQAVSDGLAIIDGQFSNETATLVCLQYVSFIGIRVQNSSKSVISLDASPFLEFHRVSAYNANYHPQPTSITANCLYDNYHVMEVTYQSNYVLVEDAIFAGYGRDLFNWYRSDHGILQHSLLFGGAFTRSGTISGAGPCSLGSNHGEAMQIYEGNDNVVANVMFYGLPDWSGHPRYTPAGVNVWNNSGGQTAHRNKYLGTVLTSIKNFGYYNNKSTNCSVASTCIQDSLFENIVCYECGTALVFANGLNINANYVTLYRSGLGEGASAAFKTGLYLLEDQEAGKTSTYITKNMLIVNGVLGCRGETSTGPPDKALQAGDASMTYTMFFGNTTTQDSGCSSRVTQSNITTASNPALDSILYVKAGSPALTAGEGGGRVGADTRCRYVASYNGTDTVVNHTTESLWPWNSTMATRAINETADIHGNSGYDINALLLDLITTRDSANIGCPDATPPVDPSTFVSSTGTTSTSHAHTFAANVDRVAVCVALYDSGGNVGSVSGITVGGAALALMTNGRVVTSPAYRAVEVWQRASPASGSQTIAVSTTGTVTGMSTTSIALEPSTATGAVSSTTGLGTMPSMTVATGTTDTVYDCTAMSSTPTITPGTSQTLQTETAHASQSIKLATTTQAGSAGGLMSSTLSSNNYYAVVGFANGSGPASSSTFRLSKYGLYSEFGPSGTPELATVALASANSSAVIGLGGSLRIRTELIVEAADSVSTGFTLFCRKNADSYAQITDSYGSNPVKFIGNIPIVGVPNPGAATTQRLSVGNFTAGMVSRTTGTPTTLGVIPQNNTSEIESILDVNPSLTVGDTVNCRIYKDNGTAIDTYTVTPTFTVTNPSAATGP